MTMTLKQLYKAFPKEEDAILVLEKIRWDNLPICPHCKVSNFTPLLDRYHCNGCNSSFSVTAKTIFARTRCDLRKWFYCIYYFAKPVKKTTARELGEMIKTTKDTAWLIMKKIAAERIKSESLFEEIILEINKRIK